MKPKLGKLLIKLGISLIDAPDLKPKELTPNLDAVVETDETQLPWKPEQEGNVVVVEPDLVRLERNGELSKMQNPRL